LDANVDGTFIAQARTLHAGRNDALSSGPRDRSAKDRPACLLDTLVVTDGVIAIAS
jgi:hypothetical protein